MSRGQVRRAVGGLGEIERHAGFVEEGLRGDGLRGVLGEVVGHQLEERIVAQLAAERIQEEHALRLLDAHGDSCRCRARASGRGR